MIHLFAKVHKAKISHNLIKVDKRRMISRATRISNSIKTSKDMPKEKIEKLKAELKNILEELDARSDAVE